MFLHISWVLVHFVHGFYAKKPSIYRKLVTGEAVHSTARVLPHSMHSMLPGAVCFSWALRITVFFRSFAVQKPYGFLKTFVYLCMFLSMSKSIESSISHFFLADLLNSAQIKRLFTFGSELTGSQS